MGLEQGEVTLQNLSAKVPIWYQLKGRVNTLFCQSPGEIGTKVKTNSFLTPKFVANDYVVAVVAVEQQ